MNEKIRQRLKNNDFVNMLYRFLTSKEYRKLCADFGRHGRTFRFECLGEENPEDNIYFIREGSSAQGMFSIVIWTLRRLELAHKFRFTPVVTWAENVPVSVDRHPNPFLLYYQPVSGISVESALHSENIAFSNKWDCAYGTITGHYQFSQAEIDRLALVYHKYLRLRPELRAKIAQEVSVLIRNEQEKILGVHARGVEWRKNNIIGHPIAITEEQYLDKARGMMKELGCGKVFLASDSERTVELFRSEFGECLITADAVRTSERNDELVIFDKNNDGYRLGIEVLRDAHALAACDSLLCGLSYVSYGAQIIKKAKGEEYRRVVILDKGKHDSGISLPSAVNIARKSYR